MKLKWNNFKIDSELVFIINIWYTLWHFDWYVFDLHLGWSHCEKRQRFYLYIYYFLLSHFVRNECNFKTVNEHETNMNSKKKEILILKESQPQSRMWSNNQTNNIYKLNTSMAPFSIIIFSFNRVSFFLRCQPIHTYGVLWVFES